VIAPILTYHSLDASGSAISTHPADFRRQMEALREGGFEALTLRALLDAWTTGTAPPRKPVVLTFDDGLRTVMTEAVPVLRGVSFAATVFAVAGRLGGDNGWPGQAAWAPRQDLLAADELAGLASEGWEVGAHGVTHASLSDLGPAAQEDEIVRSKQILESRTGAPVTSFAYPYGDATSTLRAQVARHYRAACSADLGVAGPADDRHWLPRVDAYYLRGPGALARLGTPAFRAYLAARQTGRRLRRALARRGARG
jgi:peptidoglycan/xylan/chitin deacetylase (PgdA/CDA1 family)